jgi:small subunit ribosomal protein S4
LEVVTEALSGKTMSKFSWLEWDKDKMEGKFLDFPMRDQIPENIKEQLIVELYSK